MTDNIKILHETLRILKRGSYKVNGRTVHLKLSGEAMKKVLVLLPENVQDICEKNDFEQIYVSGRCHYDCINKDSFTAAKQLKAKDGKVFGQGEKQKPVLVLNMANPVHPGGGVRRGARAQEEDLCRNSSLLLSLESKSVAKYYEYNRVLNTYMGSDAMIITPEVEIIRNANGQLLNETTVVSVLTCAAPMVRRGKEGMSEKEYRYMIYHRIIGMLKCAAYFGYKNLVLGAWGCGAFGNDARLMSDLFYKALKELDFHGLKEKDLFQDITFAVLDRTPEQYNFKEFDRNFAEGNFYREEDRDEKEKAKQRLRASEIYLDKIKGSLVGGAAGDALGYPVEFLGEEEIFRCYGAKGIQEYVFDSKSGKALISDDTQMTLFTANGILVANTRAMRGIGGIPSGYIPASYQDWLCTQEMSFQEYKKEKMHHNHSISWLMDVPELFCRRAPGTTCLSALRRQRKAKDAWREYTQGDYITHPQNNSKGCGGIMRVAPLALQSYLYRNNMKKLQEEAAQIAAITHGHSLGYMPTAVLVHIIHRLVYMGGPNNLEEIILEARNTAAELFAGDKHLPKLIRIINLAIELSHNTGNDLENIHQIGEGWTAEETLGIAIYCSLKYQSDFSAGIIAAVNHRGDSDSTGAVTGNILGALCGYRAIENKWKQNLELLDVIQELAADLCHGCQMHGWLYSDPDWEIKYEGMRRKSIWQKSES